MTKTILGLFNDRESVEGAIDELRSNGYNPKDFSIVMKNAEVAQEIVDNTGANVVASAAEGAAAGAVIGGLAGLLAATTIPGLGAFLIGGPIAAAMGFGAAAASTISGAATGVVAGGLLGALMGFGLPKDEATHYERMVTEGAILLAVPISLSDEFEVLRIFEDFNATDVKTISQTEDFSTKTPVFGTGSHYAYAGTKGGKGKKKRK